MMRATRPIVVRPRAVIAENIGCNADATAVRGVVAGRSLPVSEISAVSLAFENRGLPRSPRWPALCFRPSEGDVRPLDH